MNEIKKQERHIEENIIPFFSIIMPVYNAAPFLRDSIGSIQAQDFKDWELIIVDDKSSDASASIAKEFCQADERIIVFTSASNSGGCHAPRMRAASIAKGAYIVPIDADDSVAPNYLSVLHNSIIASNTDLVLTEMWKQTGGYSFKLLPITSIDTARSWKGKDLVIKTLVKWQFSMNGFAIRRAIYLDADRNLKLKVRESCFVDEVLSRWILFLSSKVVFCDARYYYRDNSQSVTKTNHLRLIYGMLKNCDSLIDMTSETFGARTPTHLRALEHKLYSAVGFLRLVNSEAFDDNESKRSAIKNISDAMKGFDLSLLKGKTSPRYLALMRLPIPMVRIALKIWDSIIRRKNGI